jgi:hypothetical protein
MVAGDGEEPSAVFIPVSMDLSVHNKTYMKIGIITLTLTQDP